MWRSGMRFNANFEIKDTKAKMKAWESNQKESGSQSQKMICSCKSYSALSATCRITRIRFPPHIFRICPSE